MSAPTLFGVLTPRTPDGIDLRCCDVREMLRSVRGAALVVADPPWQYAREAGVANPETHDIYDGMSEGDIADVLDLAHDSAADDARLACWATWPKLREKCFLRLEKELPYSVHVEVEDVETHEDGSRFIAATIWTTDDRYKKMLIGAGGSMIKQIGIDSRKEIEAATGHKCRLELLVKTDPKWPQRFANV
jgi:hypothetical protein